MARVSDYEFMTTEQIKKAIVPAGCVDYLRSCLLFPNAGEPKNLHPIFYAKSLLMYAIASLPLYYILYDFFTYDNTPMEVLIYEFSILAMGPVIMSIMLIFLSQLHTIRSTLIEGAFFIQDENELIDLKKRQEKIIKTVKYLLATGVCSFATVKLFLRDSCMERFDFKDHANYCQTMFPIVLPFDINYFPMRHVVTLIQAYSTSFILGGMFSIFCVGLCGMQALILGEKQLIQYLSDFKPGRHTTYKSHIRNFCNFHSKTKRFAQSVENISYGIHFVHIVWSSLLFAILATDICMNHNLLNSFNLFGWLLTLAYLAKLGEDIVDKSKDLCNAIYNLPWYEMDNNLRQDILFIMMVAQKLIYIRAGPSAILYRATFLKVLQRVSSYITMIINFVYR